MFLQFTLFTPVNRISRFLFHWGLKSFFAQWYCHKCVIGAWNNLHYMRTFGINFPIIFLSPFFPFRFSPLARFTKIKDNLDWEIKWRIKTGADYNIDTRVVTYCVGLSSHIFIYLNQKVSALDIFILSEFKIIWNNICHLQEIDKQLIQKIY